MYDFDGDEENGEVNIVENEELKVLNQVRERGVCGLHVDNGLLYKCFDCWVICVLVILIGALHSVFSS